MFSIVQLECFVAVAEELHFGAAAERMRMTQPPLSRQIQLIERELDTMLFLRTSRSVQLTTAGKTLLPNARRILDLVSKAAVDVRRVAAGASGTLNISYTATAAQSALPQFLKQATAQLPDVALGLRELVSTDQMDELAKGTVDLGLLRPIVARPGIQTRALLTERMIAAVPTGSRMAELAGPISLIEFADERLIMCSPADGRYFHDLVLTLFAVSGIQPFITQYVTQVPAQLALVHAGLGVALVPESARKFSQEGVVFKNLDRRTPMDKFNTVGLSVAWSDENTNPALHAALEVLLHLAPDE